MEFKEQVIYFRKKNFFFILKLLQLQNLKNGQKSPKYENFIIFFGGPQIVPMSALYTKMYPNLFFWSETLCFVAWNFNILFLCFYFWIYIKKCQNLQNYQKSQKYPWICYYFIDSTITFLFFKL